MTNVGWTSKAPVVGQRVEIAPHYDLWMQGARFGTVVSVNRRHSNGVRYRLRMDHPQVKRLAVVWAVDCRPLLERAA